ncbi:MAG TPA: hypothetical protein VGF55_20445 [Gemmataceae bacterium]|jgi:hypothetical protein
MRDHTGNVHIAVYAADGLTGPAVVALGRALAAWQAAEPAVTAIDGLDRLLAGRYPQPIDQCPMAPDPDGEIDGTPLGRGRFTILTPWRYCPAVVTTTGWDRPEEELIASLRRAVPAELLGTVTDAVYGLR